MVAAVQPAWVAHSVITGQEGIIRGCVVSASARLSNHARRAPIPSEASVAGTNTPMPVVAPRPSVLLRISGLTP